MTDTDQRPTPPGAAGHPAAHPGVATAGHPVDAVADAVRAALAVPGVSGVRVDRDADGTALLHLDLVDGADEDDVARAVQDELRRAALPAPAPAPALEHVRPVPPPLLLPPPLPQPLDRPAPRPRTGRVPVPSVSSPAVAATPAPQWLGEALDGGASGGPGAAAPPAVAPGGAADRLQLQRVQLQRVQVVTEGLTTTATVVLASGSASHTGVADAAATPTGGHRCVATAAVRALESAAGGRLRAEVDAVTVTDLGGHPCALVLLGAVSASGPEQLVGASLADGDVPGALVRAVLAAGNRRLAPGSADRAGERGRAGR